MIKLLKKKFKMDQNQVVPVVEKSQLQIDMENNIKMMMQNLHDFIGMGEQLPP